jgi:hypothetical protein
MYPIGGNKLWVWDSYWQSVNLRAWFDNPTSVATKWMDWTRTEATLSYAEYLE